MNRCQFIDVGTDEAGRRVVRCEVCGFEQTAGPGKVVRRCRKWTPRQETQTGPGTELKEILDSLGIKPTKSCNCAAMIRKMNAWGPDGCLDYLPEIVAHLKAAYSSLTWEESRQGYLSALATGLAWEIDWIDPLPSLVRLAVERSRQPR